MMFKPKSILLIAFLLVTLVVFSQKSPLGTKVQYHCENESIKNILKELSSQTDLSFSFDSKLFGNKKISISCVDVTVDSLLTLIFHDKNIQYEDVDGVIVLKRSKKLSDRGFADSKNDDSTTLHSQKAKEYFTVSGYLRDKQNGEVLIGCVVSIDSLHIKTISNEYGFYSITAPKGVFILRCSYDKYEQNYTYIDFSANLSLNIDLSSIGMLLDEVVVNALDYKNVHQYGTVSLNLSSSNLQAMPAYLGEADLLKQLEKIPGVKSFGDGSTAYYVRGGDKAQNLIILDDAPVFNPTHLFGFYSSFVADAVKDVKIYKGNAPANYGGRLSSVVDVRTKDGNMKKLEIAGSIGPFVSKIQMEAPIVKDYSSFLISFRRSNLNWMFAESDPKFNFNDLNIKLNAQASKQRFYVNFYRGNDSFSGLNTEFGHKAIGWTNTVGSVRWNYLISKKIFSNLTLFGSLYNYDLMLKKNEFDKWSSQISTIGFKYDLSTYINPRNTLKYGFDYTEYSFNPGNIEYTDSAEVFSAPVVSQTKLRSAAFLYIL
ncbi:MAG: carboxypeptidase-like regulatory domain-containing protein [Bacteroidales bacterium]|nr:carboxypeptidase-like regulatory domain-containing protein [Bacteroidales bacterium]